MVDHPVSHRVSVLRGTQDTPGLLCLRVRDSHPLWWCFPAPSTSAPLPIWGPTTPVYTYTGLAFSAFARHYSRNHLFSSGYLDVSVPPVPFLSDDPVSPGPGFPIRTSPTARGCIRLVGAFRSIPRPSSALDTKASAVCPYSLFTYVIRRTRHFRKIAVFGVSILMRVGVCIC